MSKIWNPNARITKMDEVVIGDYDKVVHQTTMNKKNKLDVANTYVVDLFSKPYGPVCTSTFTSKFLMPLSNVNTKEPAGVDSSYHIQTNVSVRKDII